MNDTLETREAGQEPLEEHIEIQALSVDLRGVDLLRPSRELNFGVRRHRLCLRLAFGPTPTFPALKELEEWFDTQKEMRAITKLDPFFERTSKLASRRLKRELERRGTLGEFALEPDTSTKRIPHRGKRL